MLRSMYSGITGLKANQTKLDVVGNNIANVSTTSFKSQTIRFKDSLSQTLGTASAPGNNMGGTNPKQIGLGVQVAGITTLMSQGNMQTTGSNLDCAIDGDGYFMVASGPAPATNATGVAVSPTTHSISNGNGLSTFYTRDGSFTLDSNGNLLNSDGYRVLGYPLEDKGNTGTSSVVYPGGTCNYINADSASGLQSPDADGCLVPLIIPDSVMAKDASGTDVSVKIRNFSIEKDGIIKATLEDGRTTALGQIAMASFKNPAGLEKLGKNLYSNGSNSGTAIVRSAINPTDPNTNNSAGFGSCMNGYLEMSNVDLAEQFTEMIVASRAFQANGKMITTGDEILQDLVNLKR